MDPYLRVLSVDAGTTYYRVNRYPVGEYFGPVDLGFHLATKYRSLNIGTGLLAGSIFPGSNRLIVNGYSPCWTGFYISSMGGAGLIFDNLGINLLSIIGKAGQTSILYLNRIHGEEIEVELKPVNLDMVWNSGRNGVYSLIDYTYEQYGDRYVNDPRILATGPAAATTDFGAIASVPIKEKKITYVDTWAGRGGFGTKMLKDHGIAAIIYGGTFVDEDFRDRKVADEWFVNKYQKKLAAKDLEATTKYRFEPKFETGGTFGVNYASLKGQMLSFNYRSIFMSEEDRIKLHEDFILKHYLKQFNEETIHTKQQKTCGEPCVAVCKKMHNEFKKDYEPYQTMGPLSGIFDQRAAEKINHHADMLGFDAISVGGIVAWIMECLHEDLLDPDEVEVSGRPIWDLENFDIVKDSMHNAELGIEILDAIIEKRGILDMSDGARSLARDFAKEKKQEILDKFVYTAFARKGWMVPNQYWTPGVLSPMVIMGKYYMFYGNTFTPPRELGKTNAERFKQELILDNMGMCRFHRAWAEEMLPEIVESLYGMRDKFIKSIELTAGRVNSRNSSVFWETERNIDMIHQFLIRKKDVDGVEDKDLDFWIAEFDRDKHEAAQNFWYEIHKGIQESLREF